MRRFTRAFSSAASLVHIPPTAGSGAPRTFPPPFPLRALRGYINGAWVPAASGATTPVLCPADGAALCVVPDMGRADTEAAIAAAVAALPAWAARPAAERCAILRRFYEAVLANVDGLAVLLSLEAGKPLEEAKGEVRYAADFLEWYAEEGKRPQGEVLTPSRADRRMLTLAAPVGPCALLTPWNFPAAMPTRKLGPALAAGCTMVLRPAVETPLSAMALVQLAEGAGVPPGVLNLVVGRDHGAIAGELTASPHIKKVSFTGSVRVGKLLMADCAGTLKRLSLELGGQAPFLVFEDAGACQNIRGQGGRCGRPSHTHTIHTPPPQTLTRRWRAPWPQSSATRGRRACAPTPFSCTAPCCAPSRTSWRRACPRWWWATAW